MSRRSRRALSFVVGGGGGRRSRTWSVTVGRNGAGRRPAVALGVEHDLADPGPVCTVDRAGWELILPRGLVVDAGSDVVGSSLVSPAAGWEVGAVLLVPQTALSVPAGTAVASGCHRVPAPPPGHHVQLVLLLGEPDAVALNLTPAQDVGSLETDRGRLQLWRHTVPTSPGAFARWAAPGPAWSATPDRVPLVVDPG